jgi:uncharacterized membrane protein
MVLTLLALLAGGLLLPREYGWAERSLASLDSAMATLLLLDATVIFGSDAEETRKRAAALDPGRTLLWFVVLTGSAVGLFSAALAVRASEAHTASALLPALGLGAVLLAWFLTHASFALRYAHLYFRDGTTQGSGLKFPHELMPDALDFAYYAFTLGMCFQVSDVSITSRQMRRASLGHALLSFAYNTVILAVSLNFFAGLVG